MGGMGALTGAVGGAVTGGVLQGLSAVRNGGDFWKGVRFKPEIILPDMSKINKPEVPKIDLGHGYADVSHGPSSGIGQQLNPSATGSNLPAKMNAPVNNGSFSVRGGKELYNFGEAAAKHMTESSRRVPLQLMDDVIKTTKGLPDPEGSRALMHYSTMWKNDKLYNLEILYDQSTNSIWHFKYSGRPLGPLPATK